MIKRLVKITIRPECAGDFISLFNVTKSKIMAFKGCRHLELLRDVDDEQVFITFSIWDSAEDLELYRESQLSLKTWQDIKEMFGAEPEAHSTVFTG